MKARVTDEGVLIPKELLGDAEEVEITRDDRVIMVIPAGLRDPILGLGEQPVACGAPDASEAHDKYLVDTSR
jgi:hypothetical protein